MMCYSISLFLPTAVKNLKLLKTLSSSKRNIFLHRHQHVPLNLQQAWDDICSALKKFSSRPNPIKMPLASQQLVSFQNRQWLYTLLQNVWSVNMKTIMLCYQELYDKYGVVLWYCFLTHFVGMSPQRISLSPTLNFQKQSYNLQIFKITSLNLQMPSVLQFAPLSRQKRN